MERPTSSASAALPNKLTDFDKLQQVLDKVRDLKQSLSNFFMEYEHGQPSWPTVLDQMNVLSSQITTLRMSTRHLLPLLRSNSIIPICLSPEPDPSVEQLTERRLSILNHDFMPQLLRTKNLPEIEERERLLTSNSTTTNLIGRASTPSDIPLRVQELNGYLNHIHEQLHNTKTLTDRSEKQFDQQRFSNPAETKRLLEAMNYGTGLKLADTSASPITTSEQANMNASVPSQPQRQAAPNVRIKTVSKPNR